MCGARWIGVGGASCVTAFACAGTPLTTVHVANVDWPTMITHAPGDPDRLFVTSRPGCISVLRDGMVLPFLDLTALIEDAGNEQGLLGLAFHPDYQANGYFYVNYTGEPAGNTFVVRYQVTADPDVADPASAHQIVEIAQPGTFHNGGWLGFGPNDGFLYVATGDGPSQDGAQLLISWLGKLLRLDVDGDDFPGNPDRNYAIPQTNPLVGVSGLDELWAYGLRNPWRLSFDRATGDLYIGDVGLAAWEEVNFQPAASAGGENYGWDCKEALVCLGEPGCDCAPADLVDPFFVYENPVGESAAVIGGYVYRGCAIPDLAGTYFFGDVLGRIWSLRYDGSQVSELVQREKELAPEVGSIGAIWTFGEDAAGEIFIGDAFDSQIFKIVPETITDCNGNGVADGCDIADGTSADGDGNGVPDECELPGDVDGDGVVGISDLLALLAAWGPCPGGCPPPCVADFTDDCVVGIADLLVLLANWT